jgi:type II secretory pathway component PulF
MRTRVVLNVVLPLMLVVLGGCILCFAVGMLLPLFSLISGLA